MSLNYSDIAEHVDAGKNASEILAILQADTRHVRDCMLTSTTPEETDVADILGDFGLLWQNKDQGWEGPLAAYVDASGNETLQRAWGRLTWNLTFSNRPLKCGTVADLGKDTTDITNLAKALVPAIADDLQAAMDAITGGLRFAAVTLTDVEACIAKHTIEPIWSAKQAVVNEGIHNGTITTLADIVAAIGGE